MSFELAPRSSAGERTVAAAVQCVPALRELAAQADADGRLPSASVDALIASGLTAAFVPEALGGFGLQSIHDWVLTIATLGRGDASTAIGMNMHLGVTRGIALAYEQALARGASTTAIAETLTAVVQGKMLICATATEPGTDNLHPLTEAVRTGDGWHINGRKIFVTLSPQATHLAMNLRLRDADGDHLATTMLPMTAPGLCPQDDWDALGMRASGSQSVVFDGVYAPLSAVRKIGPWGRWSVAMLMNRALANLPLVGAFLGIAEAAHELALTKLATKTRVGAAAVEHSGVAHLVGEMDIELAKCRAILQAAATSTDAFVESCRHEPPTLEAAHQLMKDYQAAKWVVNRGAIDIVSMAMDLLGGSGYTNSHPLARLYRDVRAGPFMQPFAPTEAREYVGKVALRQWPEQ